MRNPVREGNPEHTRRLAGASAGDHFRSRGQVEERQQPRERRQVEAAEGLANRLGARFTTHVYTGHPDTQIRNGKYLGIPIRREIAELDRLGVGDKARAHFGLRPDLPVLLVTGGSQGARSLNTAVFGAASSGAATTTTPTVTTATPGSAPAAPEGAPPSGTFKPNENATHEGKESAQREAEETAGKFPTTSP